MADMVTSSWGGEDEYYYTRAPAPRKTCKCCGNDNLYWKQVSGKWMLHENGEVHDCPKNPYAPNQHTTNEG